MAELADALDSGSNGRKAVQVQVLLPAPEQNSIFDPIKDAVLFLCKTSFLYEFSYLLMVAGSTAILK